MNTLTSLPASASASGRFYKLCATIFNTTKRHQSSYRRTRRRLNIKPDPNFLPSKTEPYDHIIHNPPPSMPNVYHTPALFLPKTDKRRLLHVPSSKPLLGNSPSIANTSVGQLPPPVKQPHTKRYHLTEADLDEMRALRRADPMKWSASELAKKFDCSGVFVRLVIRGLSEDKKEMQKQVTDAVKAQWGQKRRVAREDRVLRREQWYRDA